MMSNFQSFLCFLILLFLQCYGDDKFSYSNLKFHFLPGTGMGLLVAVALPLNLANKNAYLAYNFEANYAMPGNETHFDYPPLIQRRIDRKLIYSALETKMESNGYPGRTCLLRTICEAAAHSMDHTNGVLGDILHVIFTPSSSINEELTSDYRVAEDQGRRTSNCTSYHLNCPISLLDMISWIEKLA